MSVRVYMETSVISYLAGRPSRDLVVAAHQELTRQWWRECAGAFELVVSDLVMEEAQRGDADAACARLDAMAGMPILPTHDAAVALAEGLEGCASRHAASCSRLRS